MPPPTRRASTRPVVHGDILHVMMGAERLSVLKLLVNRIECESVKTAPLPPAIFAGRSSSLLLHALARRGA